MMIHNVFTIERPVADAWRILNDVPRVARCAPGAELIGARGDDSYNGTVAIRLGPVAMRFKGTFTYKQKDESAHRVVAEAIGNEEKARGNARATIVFILAADGANTRVNIDSDVQLAGSIAQYGRGTAIMQSTAQALIDQFAKNLAAELAQAPAARPGGAALAAPTAARPISLPRLIVQGLAKLIRQWLHRPARTD